MIFLYFPVFLSVSLSNLYVVLGSSQQTARVIKGRLCSSKILRNGPDASLLPTLTNTPVDNNSRDIFPPYCPDGYFCRVTNHHHPGFGDNVGLCTPCPGRPERCLSNIYDISVFIDGQTVSRASAGECWENCGLESNRCSSTKPCGDGLFCNPDGGDENGGYCEGCPTHIFYCQEKNLTAAGQHACLSSCALSCHFSSTIVTNETEIFDGQISLTPKQRSLGKSLSLHGSPQGSVTGPIVDCGLGLEPCKDANNSICLIERGKVAFFEKVISCSAGGGIGAIIFNIESKCGNFNGTLGTADTFIPSLSISHLEGRAILEEISSNSPLIVTLSVGDGDLAEHWCEVQCYEGKLCEGMNTTCNFDQGEKGSCMSCTPTKKNNFCQVYCNNNTLCADGLFCDYAITTAGTCKPCPEGTGQKCFYSDLTQAGTKECSDVCGNGQDQELEALPCKFCPKVDFTFLDISDGSIAALSKNNDVGPCEFCPLSETPTCLKEKRWNMTYPNRILRSFGGGVECWVVAEFFRNLNIRADDPRCRNARLHNYLCGCSESPGYAGANTKAKQLALVWMPRVSAILSFLGSLFIIIDVSMNKKVGKMVLGNLLRALSLFDLTGAVGYAFTSFPSPKDDFLLGANGNEATCKAQGFFIQMGTISSYMNVSMSFYYLLTIRYGWRDEKLRKSKYPYLLFVVPIAVGAFFAFIGIPFYDNMVLWCNNTAYYWPEVPVVVAIVVATAVMANLCWFVYQEEKASLRWRQHNANTRDSLSKKFFIQSLSFLAAFYLTWPPYLALQFMLASGAAYSNYKFFLFAGTFVPLQGFWNFLAYYRTRKITFLSRMTVTITARVEAVRTSAFSKISKFSESVEPRPHHNEGFATDVNAEGINSERVQKRRDTNETSSLRGEN